MVGKSVILFGIKHLQQSAGGVATKVCTKLVNLIQQKQRIACTSLTEILQNLARQRPNIGAPVATDFRFVAHASQRHAHIFASRSLGNGLTK